MADIQLPGAVRPTLWVDPQSPHLCLCDWGSCLSKIPRIAVVSVRGAALGARFGNRRLATRTAEQSQKKDLHATTYVVILLTMK